MIALLMLAAQDAVLLESETGPFVGFKECYREFAPGKARPKEVSKAPEGATDYYAFEWGDRTAVVAAGKDRLWPDRDGDGDLAEEEPVESSFGWEPATTFAMTLKLPSRTVEARLQARFTDGRGMRLTNLTRMSGTVVIGGKKTLVSLTDYHVNGRYDDYYTTKTEPYWHCDHAHFDIDGDGKFEAGFAPGGEDCYLGRGYAFGDAAYAFEVLDRGERLRFAKKDLKLATVRVNVPTGTMWFDSDEYGLCILQVKDGTGRMPEGEYRLNLYGYAWEGARVDANVWQEDRPGAIRIRDGMEFPLRGELRYTLEAELQMDSSGHSVLGPFVLSAQPPILV